jgi:acetyl-CoA acetyltransferase
LTIDLRSKGAIVGVGATSFSRSSPNSSLRLTAEALKAALDDAGLGQDDVDGIACHLGTPYGDDYDRMAYALGLNIRHAAQYFTHGRFITLSLQNAAITVAAGLADVVACIYTFKTDSITGSRWVAKPGESDHEGAREGGGPHGQQPAFGLTSMTSGVALAGRRYLEVYGLDDNSFMPVVLSARQHAATNPHALLGAEPLSVADYVAEPFVMDPIRASDGAVYGDGSIVVLVASAERARTLRKPPVYIRGMQGMRTGREEFLFARRGLGVMQQGVGRSIPESILARYLKWPGQDPLISLAFMPMTYFRRSYCLRSNGTDIVNQVQPPNLRLMEALRRVAGCPSTPVVGCSLKFI